MFLTLDYVELFKALCHDLDIPSRTQQYCLKRLNCEGLTFLTVTLPKLANLVLQGIELGSLSLVKQDFTCFRWKGNALVDFDKLLCDLFCVDGSVKSNADPVTLWRIRQLSHYFYKLNLEFSDEQTRQAEIQFNKVEQEISESPMDCGFIDSMRKNLETSYDFPSYDRVFSDNRPRMGPGTFSTVTKAKEPWFVNKISSGSVNGYLPYCEPFKGFFKLVPSVKNSLVPLMEDTAPYSEVMFVPKDSRGPRTIVREPLFALKGQMSFFDYFSRFFEKNTNSRINFSDQMINRSLARQGSISGDWSTIDLKEASDRVSFDLVKRLSKNIPVLRFFLKFRTSEAVLPSGLKLKLSKLAGMGSGLTFVWLALICHTSIATEISRRTGQPFSVTSKDVYVYGDDIIVRSCHVNYAFDALSKVGLAVNKPKSFYRKVLGHTECFRESCGGDYYAGNDVGITRFKAQNCKSVIDRVSTKITFGNTATALSVVNAHAAEMSLAGHRKVAWYLYLQLERACSSKFPFARVPSSNFTRVTREFISKPRNEITGMYSTVSVLCTRPVISDYPVISEYWHYAGAIRPSVVDSLSYLDKIAPPLRQFEITVPREVYVTRRRISGFALMG